MLVFQSEAQLFTKERLLNNENFDKISKKIGISRRSFDNIIYQFNLIENTDWVHKND